MALVAHTVVLASILGCVAACLLVGAMLWRTRRDAAGQAGRPGSPGSPAMVGAPVAAGVPTVAGAPRAVEAPAPAPAPLLDPAPAPSFAQARRQRNSAAAHFGRPRDNFRLAGRTLPGR